MFPDNRRSAPALGASDGGEPNPPRAGGRSMPRLMPLERPADAAVAPPRQELVAGERISVVSGDRTRDSTRAKRILARIGLVILIILAAIGVASLAQRFLGL
jgi:hypothetical protein